jgi:hypothetical protein
LELCLAKKYVCKYIKISNWSYAYPKNMFASIWKVVIEVLLRPFFHCASPASVKQHQILSFSFKCDQIFKCQRYDFYHTWLCYLSRNWMFNKSHQYIQRYLMSYRYMSIGCLLNYMSMVGTNAHRPAKPTTACTARDRHRRT